MILCDCNRGNVPEREREREITIPYLRKTRYIYIGDIRNKISGKKVRKEQSHGTKYLLSSGTQYIRSIVCAMMEMRYFPSYNKEHTLTHLLRHLRAKTRVQFLSLEM